MAIVYLMRHGQAESFAGSDQERPLTAYGVAYTRQIASQLLAVIEKQRFSLPQLIHSPYRRAVETADIVEDVLGGLETRLTLPGITPDDSPKEAFERLENYAEAPFILVTHMPLVAAVGSLVEQGNMYEGLPFQTSEIRAYEMAAWGAGCGTLSFRLY